MVTIYSFEDSYTGVLDLPPQLTNIQYTGNSLEAGLLLDSTSVLVFVQYIHRIWWDPVYCSKTSMAGPFCSPLSCCIRSNSTVMVKHVFSRFSWKNSLF